MWNFDYIACMKKKQLIVSMIMLVIIISFQTFTFALDANRKFVSVADIHFDPLASCSISLHACPLAAQLIKLPYQMWEDILLSYDDQSQNVHYYHDTNYSLLKVTFNEIKRLDQKERFEFAVVLGDILAHRFRTEYILYSHDYTQAGYQNFVRKIFQFIAMKFQQTLPSQSIYFAVGNNDTYDADYTVKENGIFLQQTAITWSKLILDKENRNLFLQSFHQSGYYSVNLSPKYRLIVLNSVLFSAEINDMQSKVLALSQLDWLHQELMKSKLEHQKVLLAFHIPVGINVVGTLKNYLNGVQEFWQPTYTTIFNDNIKEYASIISAILPAHIHREELQLGMLSQPSTVNTFITPSISPIFGNNPSFKVFSYDVQNYQLTDTETYYYRLDKSLKACFWEKRVYL